MSNLFIKQLIVSADVIIEHPGWFVIRTNPMAAEPGDVIDKAHVTHGPFDTEAEADDMARSIKGPGFRSAFFPGIDDGGMSLQ